MENKIAQDFKAKKAYFKLKKRQQWRKATLVAAALLLIFMALVFFALPPQLPWAMQKLLGIVNAVLAALVGSFAIREYGQRIASFQVPLIKKRGNTGVVLATGLFALVGAWWMSSFAPIAVWQGGPEEIARLFSDEVSLAVLVMPNTSLAVIEPPLPPPRAAELARFISNDADDYSRLIKAIAERKYIEADALSRSAANSQADPLKVAIASGQSKVFAGEYAAAIEHFEKAIAAGGDASVLAQTAVVYALAGNVRKSYEIASRLLDGVRSGRFNNPNALGMSLNLKAAIAVSFGRFPEALSLAEESQLHWEAAADSPFKAASRNNQAVVYAMLPKKFSGAETQFDGALTLWRDYYGADSAHVASNRANLGVLAFAQANFVKAEKRLNDARTMAARWVPVHTGGHFCTLNALARLNTLLGRFSRAASNVAAAQDCVGQSPLLEAALQGTEGSLLTGQGKFRDALSSFAKAISIGQSTVAPEHLFLADLQSQKAAVGSLRGRLAETVGVCQQVIKTVDEQLGGNHPVVARTRNTLGWELVRAEKRGEAKKQFELAQQIFEFNRKEIPISPDQASSLAGLAQTFARRDWRDGVNKLREAIALDLEVFGPALGAPLEGDVVNIPSTARYLYEQAVLFATHGSGTDLETADQLFEQALTMQTALLPPGHPALAATYEAYAQLLAKMGRKERAEEMEAKARQAHELSKELE